MMRRPHSLHLRMTTSERAFSACNTGTLRESNDEDYSLNISNIKRSFDDDDDNFRKRAPLVSLGLSENDGGDEPVSSPPPAARAPPRTTDRRGARRTAPSTHCDGVSVSTPTFQNCRLTGSTGSCSWRRRTPPAAAPPRSSRRRSACTCTHLL